MISNVLDHFISESDAGLLYYGAVNSGTQVSWVPPQFEKSSGSMSNTPLNYWNNIPHPWVQIHDTELKQIGNHAQEDLAKFG